MTIYQSQNIKVAPSVRLSGPSVLLFKNLINLCVGLINPRDECTCLQVEMSPQAHKFLQAIALDSHHQNSVEREKNIPYYVIPMMVKNFQLFSYRIT